MCPLGTHENMDKSLQFLSFMVLLYEGFYIEHILLAKK